MNRGSRSWIVLGCALILGLPSLPAASRPADAQEPDTGAELIGRPAPEWSFTRWVRGPRRSLRDLRGKVVLVRWWTENCHYCRSTLPALETLRHEHPDLVVLGVFHPKPEPREVSDRHILEVARQLGFDGPVAFDRDWRTLDRYWLDGSPDRNWTSVSFLIDRDGIIRWVHGGGEYHPSSDPKHQSCEIEYEGLERALSQALGQRPAHPAG
jgi:thiol-disulfide isomerase/thioredoxin